MLSRRIDSRLRSADRPGVRGALEPGIDGVPRGARDAGLWDTWKSPEGEVVESCTILTTTPNEFIAPIHNRMPVVLSGEAEALWLDPVTEDSGVVTPLLVPCPAEEMDSYIVSQLVNLPRNNDPECITPVESVKPIQQPLG